MFFYGYKIFYVYSDVGWKMAYSWSTTCVPENETASAATTHSIPAHCPEGTTYTRTKGWVLCYTQIHRYLNQHA